MASIAEQLAALAVTDSLKHAALPATFTKMPWASDTGLTWSEANGWEPQSFSGGQPAGVRSGIYYNVAEQSGPLAAILTHASGSDPAERQQGVWLSLAATPNPTGYQALVVGVSGTKHLAVIREWLEGTLVGERSASVELAEAGSQVAVVALPSLGKVCVYTRKEAAAPFVRAAELPSSSFAKGFAGLDGNGSNPFLQNFTVGALVPPAKDEEALVGPATAQTIPPSQIAVMAIAEGGRGKGFDLTDDAQGLVYSNVNPGGDENCTFTLARSWFAENPELGKGNLLLIVAGIDVLWMGRIEETDRATGDQEQIAVTAYGLGNRLSDNTMREIYIDSQLGKWGEVSSQRKIEVINAGYAYAAGASVTPGGAGSARSALFFDFTGVTATATLNEGTELMYYGTGIDIGHVYFDQIGDATTTWSKVVALSLTDLGSGWVDTSPNYSGITESLGQGVHAAGSGRKYAFIQAFYTNNAFAGQMTNKQYFQNVYVIGTHGLQLAEWPAYGLTADQIVGNVIQRVPGITARRIDQSSFLIQQFVIETATHHLDVLAQLAELAEVDYGTWGPNSPLDNTTNGYFDWKEKDRATQHWFATRADFEEDLTFHSELATLYDTVEVSYTDEAGIVRSLTQSIYSRDLQEADLSPRTYSLDAGQTTTAGAQIYAEIFLAIFAGFSPARGSGTLAGMIRHYRRGKIPAYYLRADGSNIRIPDILPAETAFSLDSTPDRRTTFPIQRVTVDLSGDYPKTNVSFDQASEALSILLAQQTLQAQIAVE
jgi:hypothetical protein